MNFSRQLLLGLLVLGLQTGLATAQSPAALPALPPVVAAPTPTVPVLAAPAKTPAAPAASAAATPAPAIAGPTNIDCTTCGCGCDTGCNDRTGIIGGVGLYIIQPYFNDNTAFALQATGNRSTGPIPPGAPGNRQDLRTDITHHMGVAPLIWLGYLTEDGIGGRARWWTFRQGTDQSIALAGGTATNGTLAFSAAPLGMGVVSGLGMEVTSQLQLQVADIEALDDIRAGNWDFLLSGGLRIARIDQAYNAFIPQSGASAVLSNNTFSGVGPTVAVEARRALGGWGLNLYTSARGSVVFGSAHQFAFLPDQNTAAADHRDRSGPIGELELGLEYGRNVGQSRLFGQIALVGQQWFGAGSASRSSLNTIPGGGVLGGAYVGDSDFDFLGLAIRFGVNY